MIQYWLEISVDPERSAAPMGPQIYRFTDLQLTTGGPALNFHLTRLTKSNIGLNLDSTTSIFVCFWGSNWPSDNIFWLLTGHFPVHSLICRPWRGWSRNHAKGSPFSYCWSPNIGTKRWGTRCEHRVTSAKPCTHHFASKLYLPPIRVMIK